jgi:hypothetical protein
MILEVERVFGIVLQQPETSDLLLVVVIKADEGVCRHGGFSPFR